VPERAFLHRPQSRSWLRGLAWSRALADARDLPGNSLFLQQADRLIRAWGDHAISVSPEYLVRCHRAASIATGTIIDFGAGVTTIVMALACRSRPASVLALEHDPDRRRRVLIELHKVSRRGGDVRLVPLRHHDDVVWLAADLHSARRPIAFVAMHPVEGLSDPHDAWKRIVAPALPEQCPVLFQ
jgi:hypothetical protein